MMTLTPITPDSTGQLTLLQETSQGWIKQIKWSPDGRLLACASAEGVVIWRGSLEADSFRFEPHTAPTKSLAFAPNGTTIATASADTTVKVWDLRAFSPQMQPIETYTDHADAVEQVIIAGNGAVVSCSVDGTIRVLRRLGKMTFTGHVGEVNTIALSYDHSLIASGGHDKIIRLWDMLSGQLLFTLEGHHDWIRALAFHPHQQCLASAGRDGIVRLWDVSDLNSTMCAHQFDCKVDVRAVTFDATGDILIAGDDGGKIWVWHTVSGHQLTSFTAHEHPIMTVTVHPKNTLLVTGSGDHGVRIWGITDFIRF